MKKCVFYTLLLFVYWSCGQDARDIRERKDLVFRCSISEQTNEKLLLEIDGKERAFDVPANGIVEVKIPQILAQYSNVSYGQKFYFIYLEGGEPIDMEFSGNPNNWDRKFSGGCKAINEYLSSPFETLESSLFYKNEEELKEETRKLLEKNLQNLEKKDLPKSFIALERERLRYDTYSQWNSYRMHHRWMVGDKNFEPSDMYYQVMHELAKERPDLFSLASYNRFVKQTIETFAHRGTEALSPQKVLENEIKYIRENYKDSMMLENLMHHFIYNYVSEHGVEEDYLQATYKQYVKNEAHLKAFEQLCQAWNKLKPGTLSPVFNFVDMNGSFVSLESLKGKYVFIDLWASWCAPCRREIPFLKKLEHQFAGKDIVFVGISCDRSDEAWRKAMKEEDLSGIQLHMNGDMIFVKAYAVSSIPRFILLDKEGRIVNARMTQPSDPKTEETLRSLPGLM